MSGTSGNTQTNVTKYMNTTRDNYKAWKRDIDKLLAGHADKLLTVVQDKELATTVKLKYRRDYKTLGEDWTVSTEQALVAEFDTTAYHLILPSIGDDTTLRTLERKYGDSQDAHALYSFVVDEWTVTTETTTTQLIEKDQARQDLLAAGMESASLAHATQFVEKLLAYNLELADTDYAMKDKPVIPPPYCR